MASKKKKTSGQKMGYDRDVALLVPHA